MFLNYNFMQDSNALAPTPSEVALNGFIITNGNFTNMDLQNIISLSVGIFDKIFPLIAWAENTIARSAFDKTTNIGAISQIIGNISRLDIQRSVHGENKWITLISIKKVYDVTVGDTGKLNATFTMYDTYNANGVIYDYRILPISDKGTLGKTIVKTVLSQFNKAYICDYEQIYNITNDWTLGSVETVQKTGMYEPFGSKYPIYIANAETQYRKGTTTALLLAPTSTNGGHIDRKAQVNLVENFNNFLTNHKGKILKDYNGNIRAVFINDSVPNEYFKELGNGIASTSFNWVEISNANDDQGLLKAGMLGKFPIIYNDRK